MGSEEALKLKKLLIISDTPMYADPRTGRLAVFEPTLREVEFLLRIFDEIVWYGISGGEQVSGFARCPNSTKIKTYLLPKAIGGNSVWLKLKILKRLPHLLVRIFRLMSKSEYIHTRGPSLPALIAILFALMWRKKKFWHKYAGNWNQQDAPLSYALQRFLLRRVRQGIVTINGQWDDQNSRILTFENPCFSDTELEVAQHSAKMRDFSGPLKFLFAGRVEWEKGVMAVIEAAANCDGNSIWYIVGRGKDEEEAKEKAAGLTNIKFLGAISRYELNRFYEECHFLVLPTVASEGFPKVISEACGHGCIPIVTTVSSIAQYITAEVGFLLPSQQFGELVRVIRFIECHRDLLMAKSEMAIALSKQFTYERFVERLQNEVFFI